MALTQTQVSQLYVSIFNRASEGEGNTYWQDQPDMATAANAMLATDAAQEYFEGHYDTDQDFIEYIYLNTFNKELADDPDGIAYWVGELTAGKSRGEVVATMVSVVEDYADSTDPATIIAYNQFVNRVEVSNYMAETVEYPPTGWETSTVFGPDGLDVTDDAASVDSGMASVDDFVPPTYTMTASAVSIYEDQAITYTITGDKPVLVDTVVQFHVVPGRDSEEDDQATNLTNLNDFDESSFNPFSVTILAGTNTATYTVNSFNDALTELTETYGVQAVIGEDVVASKTTTLLDGPAPTYQLTAADDADSVAEGEAITYTLTASAPVQVDTVVKFSVVPGDDNVVTTDAAAADFAASALTEFSVTILKGTTTATYTVTPTDDGLTELAETYTVQAVVGTDVVAEITTEIALEDNVLAGVELDADAVKLAVDSDYGPLVGAEGGTVIDADDFGGNTGTEVLRVTGNADIRIDLTNSPLNQVRGLDLNHSGTALTNGINTNGIENNLSGAGVMTVQNFAVFDFYARNPLNTTDQVNNYLGDIEYDGTGWEGDGVSTDGNIFLGGLGNDTAFGGIGNDFLAGGHGADELFGGRNADFFFVSDQGLDGGDFPDLDGGSTGDDSAAGDDTPQDSDWVLFEGSDDYEPFGLRLDGDNLGEIENLDASGNLYGFLDEIDVAMGENGMVVDGENVGIGATGQLNILGSTANNIIIGGFDNDLIKAGIGDDLLFGGNMDYNNNPNTQNITNDGADRIFGDEGDDHLVFEMDGWNRISGGGGVYEGDRFIQDDSALNTDNDEDIVPGEDTLWLTDLTYGKFDGVVRTVSDLTTDDRVRLDLGVGFEGISGNGLDNYSGYGGADANSKFGFTADQTNYKQGIDSETDPVAVARTTVNDIEHVIATGLNTAVLFGAVDSRGDAVSLTDLIQADGTLRADASGYLLTDTGLYVKMDDAGGLPHFVTLRDVTKGVDYLAAGTNDPELNFNNQQNHGAIVGNLDLRGTTGENILYAAAGDDILEGRSGNDLLSGGNGSDDFIFFLNSGDDIDVIHRQTDANGDNLWDGSFERDFAIDGAADQFDSTFTLGLPEILAPYIDGIRFELGGTEYEVTGLTADDIATWIDNLENALAATEGLEALTVSSEFAGVVVLKDPDGGIFVKLTDGWLLTGGSLPSDGVDNWYQEVGTPINTDPADRLIFASYEDRADGELVDDDGTVNSVLDDAVSLGDWAYAEDLVARFDADGQGTTILAESQVWDMTFDNLANEDTVSISVNGTAFSLKMGVAADGTAIEETMDEFLARMADLINAGSDNDTLAGTLFATYDGATDTLSLIQEDYNGGEVAFMDKPVVTLGNLSGGEPARVMITNNADTDITLFQFNGRGGALNAENVLFLGGAGMNNGVVTNADNSRSVFATALAAGGVLNGSDALILDSMTDANTVATDFAIHGDDLIYTGIGDDDISTGTGDDRIFGSIGTDSVDGGKDIYVVRTLVAGQVVETAEVMNEYDASVRAAEAGVVGVALIEQNAANGAQAGYLDTLVFSTNDFSGTRFTITVDDDLMQMVGGAGTVGVDEGDDGDIDHTTTFVEMEAIRTLAGDGTHAGQGHDTLNVEALSNAVADSDSGDPDAAVVYNMTSELGYIQINADLNDDGAIADDLDQNPANADTDDENDTFLAVDGVERLIGGNANEQLNIDESEVNKDNYFDGDDEVVTALDTVLPIDDDHNDQVGDSIVYDHTDMDNDEDLDDDGDIDNDNDGIVDYLDLSDDGDATPDADENNYDGADGVNDDIDDTDDDGVVDLYDDNHANRMDDSAVYMRPSLEIVVESGTETDLVKMTGGTIIGSDTTIDTLVDVETIDIASAAISATLDDTLNVSNVNDVYVDFTDLQVRESDGDILARITGMTQVENVLAGAGDDTVQVANAMTNFRAYDSADATTAISYASFMDYDNFEDTDDDTVDDSRIAFNDLPVADRVDANNQALFSFDGAGGQDRVDYSLETGGIAAVVNLDSGEVVQTVFVDEDGNTAFNGIGNDSGDRIDLLLNVEEVVASRGESILDFTGSDTNLEISYMSAADAAFAGTDLREHIISIQDLDTSIPFGDVSYVEFMDDDLDDDNNAATSDAADGADYNALWNRIEGSDHNEKIELTDDQSLDVHTFNLRGGANEVNYNELTKGIEFTIAALTDQQITIDIEAKDTDASGLGIFDRITSYVSSNDIVAGSLRIEASQSEDDSIDLQDNGDNLIIVGAKEGLSDILNITFLSSTDNAVEMVLTGFESLVDSTGDDVYVINDLSNFVNTLTLTDDGDNTDRDTIKLTDDAFENTAAINITQDLHMGDGDANDLEGANNIADAGGIDFDVLDISEVTDQVNITAVGNAVETDNEIIIGDIADIDSVTSFDRVSFSTNTTGSTFDLDIDAGEIQDATNTTLLSDTDGDVSILDASRVTTDLTLGATSAAADVELIGGSGDDTITGGSVNDTLIGGAGDDVIMGGVSQVNNVFTVQLNNVPATGGGLVTVFGQSVATVALDGADAIGAKFIAAYLAADFDTGAGDSPISFSYNASTDQLSFTFNKDVSLDVSAADIAETDATFTLTAPVEATPYVGAGAGNDIFRGGAGTDTLTGGLGNDSFVIVGSVSDDEAEDYVLNGALNTQAGIDGIIGGFAEVVLLSELQTAHTTTDILGNEVINGGDGTDRVRVFGTANLSTTTLTDVENLFIYSNVTLTAAQLSSLESVTLQSADSELTITGTALFSDLAEIVFNGGTVNVNGKSVTSLTAYNTAAGISTIASAAADYITGTVGNDTISSLAGDDVVLAGAGADDITGGAGADNLMGEADNDQFFYAATTDLFVSNYLVDRIDGGGGTDEIVINNLDVANFTISVGDSFGSRITGVEAITVFGDSDKVISVALNDNAFEAGIVTVDFSLDTDATGANVIDVSAESNAANDYTLTGSAGVDTITGGRGDDTIDGNAGNDILTGGYGVDTITGDAGADDIVYTAAAQGGISVITITNTGTDADDFAAVAGTNVDSIVGFITTSDELYIDGALQDALNSSNDGTNGTDDTAVLLAADGNIDFDAGTVFIFDTADDLAANNFGDVSAIADAWNTENAGTPANMTAGQEVLFAVGNAAGTAYGVYYFQDVDGNGDISAGDHLSLIGIVGAAALAETDFAFGS